MKYKAFHKLSYGLYIIATAEEGKKYGYIGNTVFQVTSDPACIAISSHKKNFTTEKILNSKCFSVSVLKKETSTNLIGEFGFMSGVDYDKFRNVETITAVTGAPVVLNSSVAWFDCEVVNTVDAGSHIIIIGKVLDSDILSDEEPLTYDYYREKYKMLAPVNAPTHIDKEKLEAEKETEKKSIPDSTGEETASETGVHDTYTCSICGFQYRPEEGDPTMGIPPGTPFSDLPDDYKCPICNAGKDYFKRD